MKVLQINKFLKFVGGAETYMFSLSEALKNRGFEIEYWGMLDNENVVEDTYQCFGKNINFQSNSSITAINNAFRTIYSKANTRNIRKILDEFKPDIVHLHNYNFQLTPSILKEIKKRNIKIVHTVHDSQLVCPYHRMYNFQKKSVCNKCNQGSYINCIKDRCFDNSILKSSLGAIESYVYDYLGWYEKYIDLFIVPSRFLADKIKNRFPHKEVVVLPNFTQKRNDLKESKKEDYYLYFGRLSPEKGIENLIQIFTKTKLNLIILGDGELKDKIIEKVAKTANIEYLGVKKNLELNQIIQKAKFVVQPSVAYENCPMSVIESFANKTPVIASNHSGFKDIIRNNENGYLIDFTDVESAKNQLIKLDRIDHKAMLLNIQHDFDQKYAEEVHLKEILKLYQEVTS